MTKLMPKEVMKRKRNPLTGDWLCWIPQTGHAYYYATKRDAVKFCANVNRAFDEGELYFDSNGKVCKRAPKKEGEPS